MFRGSGASTRVLLGIDPAYPASSLGWHACLRLLLLCVCVVLDDCSTQFDFIFFGFFALNESGWPR